jgi:two-component system sensor histidine kinase SenX3
MVVAGRQKSIAFFIAMGAGLISVILLLYVGWVLLKWQTGILLLVGVLLLAMIIAGVVLNTLFLVREIRRNEQHDAFINAVTHELKTPVASIRLYLQTLQTHTVEESKRQELRTGRIGSSSRKLNLAPVDLRAVVEQSLSRARALYHVAPDALRFNPGPNISILGDLDEVQAAVSNLVDNAVKYSGKDINVSVDATVVEGKYASVRVKDQGSGIPQTELKRIFRRFYRVPGQLTMKVKGTGLGLYIVRSVAKRHGGRAWAESDGPGHGSTFVLEFPIAK